MPAFLADYSKFYGTGERNAKGQSLDEFLEAYDAYKYKLPSCTCDAVIFSYKQQIQQDLKDLKILLVKRKNHPCIGYWALPGGFCNMEEDLETSARRELEEETGVVGLPMEQIGAFGDYKRDPRARVITTAFMSIVEESQVAVEAADDAADAGWCKVELIQTSQTEDEEKIVTDYDLHIVNEEKALDSTAKIRHSVKKGIIREEKLETLDSAMFLSDHPMIIAKGLMLLKERM
ncbi:MAG: NUDIX hydrolase [Dorea sp.]|nr:NUDIX hydrolase [Dorea sp.]